MAEAGVAARFMAEAFLLLSLRCTSLRAFRRRCLRNSACLNSASGSDKPCKLTCLEFALR